MCSESNSPFNIGRIYWYGQILFERKLQTFSCQYIDQFVLIFSTMILNHSISVSHEVPNRYACCENSHKEFESSLQEVFGLRNRPEEGLQFVWLYGLDLRGSLCPPSHLGNEISGNQDSYWYSVTLLTVASYVASWPNMNIFNKPMTLLSVFKAFTACFLYCHECSHFMSSKPLPGAHRMQKPRTANAYPRWTDPTKWISSNRFFLWSVLSHD